MQNLLEARKLVLSVLKQDSFASKDLYARILLQHPDAKFDRPPPRTWLPSGRQPVPPPPNPEHTIPSLSFLKRRVMTSLLTAKEVEKFRTTRDPTPEEVVEYKKKIAKLIKRGKKVPLNESGEEGPIKVDAWLWRIHPHFAPRLEASETIPEPKRPLVKETKSFDEIYGPGPLEHLNKRRQRARVGKMKAEKEWIEQLDRSREEGKKEVMTA